MFVIAIGDGRQEEHVISLLEEIPPTYKINMTNAQKEIHLNDEQNNQFNLITRSLQEVLGADIIKHKLSTGEQLKCYWGA